jgi:stage V sporulation protein G
MAPVKLLQNSHRIRSSSGTKQNLQLRYVNTWFGGATVQITEVRIKLMDDQSDRLQAFCSITIDNWFVVRDLKIIDGATGPFVAMPSRKLTSHCRRCRCKNHLRANFCNQCGTKLRPDNVLRDATGRIKLYADIAHPINSECREEIQKHVISEFNAELKRAESPDYYSRYDEAYGDYESSAEIDAGGDDDSPKPEKPHRRFESEGQTPSGPHTHTPGSSHPSGGSRSSSGKREERTTEKAAGESESDDRQDPFGAGIFD